MRLKGREIVVGVGGEYRAYGARLLGRADAGRAGGARLGRACGADGSDNSGGGSRKMEKMRRSSGIACMGQVR